MDPFDLEFLRLIWALMDLLADDMDSSNFQFPSSLETLLTVIEGRLLYPISDHARSPNLPRDRQADHERLVHDYFTENPIFPAHLFRRRFRMHRHLFRRVEEAVVMNNPYFVQRADATGLLSLSSLQKITVVFRMLAYATSADALDEYLRLGESTSLLCLHEFCKTIINVFGARYLRSPTAADIEKILHHSSRRGFPGMIGSLDCMHWTWKNCPYGEHGQYQDRKKGKTIILEVVATQDLWVWHAFFGAPGANSDLNVLNRSPLFDRNQSGTSPTATFKVNHRVFHQTYYLTDGIYPKWVVFQQTISEPGTEARSLYAAMLEGFKKDIERCFGVMQARWAILRSPCRLWNLSSLYYVMYACIILHNLIVEDEKDDVLNDWEWEQFTVVDRSQHQLPEEFQERTRQALARFETMRSEISYFVLQDNLVEHVWQQKLARAAARQIPF